MTHLMTLLVLQLAVVFAATWAGGRAVRAVGLPAVVGQILAGIVIGPALVGRLTLPGFPHGLFPAGDGLISVSPIVYGIATIGAIILLFDSGLETDITLLFRYAVKGGIVGVGGVIASFASAAWLTSRFLGVELASPLALFMGSLSVATSVGITASILSSRRAIGSPEGTVILAAAVVDDILGIVILAVVVGLATAAGTTSATVGFGQVLIIAGRAIGIWLFTTFLALRFSRDIARALKVTFIDRSVLTVMSLGLALFVAGLFEEAGLSMIIGAYVVGLSLSNTDIAYVVRARLKTLSDFFVPVFFATSGMMVSFNALGDWRTLAFGGLFTLVAVAAKLIGSGGPALLLGFTPVGSMRIGWGMVPRGEVALIIAGIGVANGILDPAMFGVAMIMTLATTVIAPPILNALLALPSPGQRHATDVSERITTEIDFRNEEYAEVVTGRFLLEIEKEGFLVSRLDHEDNLYQLRKDDVFISLTLSRDGKASFTSAPDDVVFFRTALYESLLEVTETISAMKDRFRPEDLVESSSDPARLTFNLAPYLSAEAIRLNVESRTKEGVIDELLDLLVNQVDDPTTVRADVFERERTMSTGMQYGIAIPHAKTSGISHMRVAIGIAREGIEFASLDGNPARIILLILSPKEGYGPHLQLLATLTGRLGKEQTREAVLAAKSPAEILSVLGIQEAQR